MYVIVTHAISDYALMQQYRSAHIEYLHQLDAFGCLFGAGPTLDMDASFYKGDGLIILKAESIDSARNIANEDPFHSNGVRECEIKPWFLSEGLIEQFIKSS